MLYTASGKFIIKENFETENLKTKSKDNNTLDIFHYDANGNLRSGTKVNNEGDYEIWTGYCYDGNCNDETKKDSQFKIDKDGNTYIKKLCIGSNCINEQKLDNIIKTNDDINKKKTDKELCIDNLCLNKKDIMISKFFGNILFMNSESNKSYDEISEVELALLLDKAVTTERVERVEREEEEKERKRQMEEIRIIT